MVEVTGGSGEGPRSVSLIRMSLFLLRLIDYLLFNYTLAVVTMKTDTKCT